MIPAKPYSKSDGERTCEGHTLTQRWHAVQRFENLFWFLDPGGVTGILRLSSYDRIFGALAFPSICLGSNIVEAPAITTPKNALRGASTGVGLDISLLLGNPSNFKATVGQASIQL